MKCGGGNKDPEGDSPYGKKGKGLLLVTKEGLGRNLREEERSTRRGYYELTGMRNINRFL